MKGCKGYQLAERQSTLFNFYSFFLSSCRCLKDCLILFFLRWCFIVCVFASTKIILCQFNKYPERPPSKNPPERHLCAATSCPKTGLNWLLRDYCSPGSYSGLGKGNGSILHLFFWCSKRSLPLLWSNENSTRVWQSLIPAFWRICTSHNNKKYVEKWSPAWSKL